jgi:hypothetical protein
VTCVGCPAVTLPSERLPPTGDASPSVFLFVAFARTAVRSDLSPRHLVRSTRERGRRTVGGRSVGAVGSG